MDNLAIKKTTPMNEPIAYHQQTKGKIHITPKKHINSTRDLSLAYTPGVAQVCQEIATNPDKDLELTNKANSIAIITDGTAVLGLGNIGPRAAIPVMEGKAVLFKELGGVDAYPLVLNETDPHKIVAVVEALAPNFSGINLEDISAPRCFEIQQTLEQNLSIPVFHDDQHGAGIAILAGLINALKVVGKDIGDIRVVINGAGAAGIATARLLFEFGCTNLTLLDKQGVLHPSQRDMNAYQQEIATLTNPSVTTLLKDALVDADVFIGLSVGNIVSQEMVQSMARNSIVFALANPTPEISPQDAQSAGAQVIATGRSDYPNQINNVLVFPGLFRGLLDNPHARLTTELMINIARSIASMVENPIPENIVPSPLDKQVVQAITHSFES